METNQWTGDLLYGKVWNRILLVLLVFFGNTSPAGSCSAIVLKNEQSVYLAKNFDWTYSNGYVIKNLRNISKRTFSGFTNNPVAWTSRYGSISFNQNGKEMPYGGINEKGLAVEMLWLDYTEYRMDPNLPVMNELEWIQYQLDNYSTVAEVLQHLDQFSVYPLKGKIHYIVADAEGHSIVIEHLGGKIKYESIEANQCQAITNYDLTTSKNWFANKENAKKGNVTQALFRYYKLQEGIERRDLQKTLSVQSAMDVLDDVAIKKGEFKTQWSIVYDLKQKSIYFKSAEEKGIKQIALNDLDFNQNNQAIDINATGKGNVNIRLTDYTQGTNTQLIQFSFDRLGLEKLDAEEFSAHQFSYSSPSVNSFTTQYCSVKINVTAADQQRLGRLGIAVYNYDHIDYSKPFKDAFHQILFNGPVYSWVYYGLPMGSYVLGAAQDTNNNRKPDYAIEQYCFSKDARVINGKLPAFDSCKIEMRPGINQVNLELK